MAKAGYLWLFERLASSILIPQEVAEEILAAPLTDLARKALEEGWGQRVSPARIPGAVLEWGLGRGESAVLALALELAALSFWTTLLPGSARGRLAFLSSARWGPCCGPSI